MRACCSAGSLVQCETTACVSLCCEEDIAKGSPAKVSPPPAFCSHALPSHWSCLCCLAGESLCVAKSHCEWPPCLRPGPSCHLCNGHHISAPMFKLSKCALWPPFVPLLQLIVWIVVSTIILFRMMYDFTGNKFNLNGYCSDVFSS